MDTAEIEARLEKLRRLNRERVNRWRARHPSRALEQQRRRQARIREALALYNERKREQPENAKAVERTERQPETIVSEKDFVEPTYEDPNPEMSDEYRQQDNLGATTRRADPRAPRVAVKRTHTEAGGNQEERQAAPRAGVAENWDRPKTRTAHEVGVKDRLNQMVDRHRRRAGVRTALDS
jgi:hypothetical protein